MIVRIELNAKASQKISKNENELTRTDLYYREI